jgi:type I restriction enzyme R subunit
MRAALTRCNPDLLKNYPTTYAAGSEQREIGKRHLGRFKGVELVTLAIVTTSQMLTTGVDVTTCRIVAIVRNPTRPRSKLSAPYLFTIRAEIT